MKKFLVFVGLILLAACNRAAPPVALPTPANPDAIGTALVKTQYPVPAGFESVGFNPIDYHREELPNSFFEVVVSFTGQYTQDSTDATGTVKMEVWENNLLRQRRVVLTFEGDAMSGGAQRLEAVRFENDFYLLDSNNICTQNSQVAQDIATLSAGRLVGGFTLAQPTGVVGEVNGYPGFQYGLAKEDLVLNIFRETPSVIDILGGEAWVLPQFNIVARFGVSMNVHNAKILFGENPVTGALRYEYNVLEISELQNIALPNGC